MHDGDKNKITFFERLIKLVKCFAEQTEVNAPGIPNKIIFFFENKLEILIFTGSSLMS